MKNQILIFAIIFFVELLYAQQKGATPLSTINKQQSTSSTYAVVVGISDYQDKDIPDLRFADKDAEAFANFLRSKAGGSLDFDHLKVLINEQSTMAQFAINLDWLLENAKENDRVIIYFSGHGDVEKKTLTQPGFLLCWDAPAQVYMSGGAFALPMLQEVISTLSIQNKSRVIIITDACHSGKLSGSSINGNQLTNANLAKQYANEIKILSCQPNEYSIEGVQWGGGRGAFSYHFLDGLYGMADYNKDLSVNLKEIGRYIEDMVSNEVSPQNQNPMVVGNATEKLTDVFPEILYALSEGRKSQAQLFTSFETKGIEDDVLSAADSNVVELYIAFKKTLKEKQYLFAEEGRPENYYSDFYYKKLIIEPQLRHLHSSMRRNYAAALQDDAQQVINDWLKIRQDQLLDRFEKIKGRIPLKVFSQKIRTFPACLERAAELLGKEHYMYATLKSRIHFFEGYLIANSNRNPNAILGEKALREFRLSLQWEPNLPQAYWQMSLVYGYNLLQPDSAEYYARIAMKLQPFWIYPYTTLAGIFMDKYRQFDRAKTYLDKAIQIDSNMVWNMIGNYYLEQKEFANAEKYYLKAINLDTTNTKSYSNLGVIYLFTRRYNDAEKYFLKVIALDSTYFYAFINLGLIYNYTQRYFEAEKCFTKSLEIDSTIINTYNNLGITYINLKRFHEAEKIFLKGIHLDSTFVELYSNLGNVFTYTQRYDIAEKYYRKAIEVDSNFLNAYYNLVCALSLQNQIDNAFIQLELLIQKGSEKYEDLQDDPDLQNIRKEKEKWKTLMKKYFPNSIKE